MKHKAKTAIVLFNLGGPDSLDAVKPFLFNLFNDKAIINLPQPLRYLLAKFISSRRAKKAQKIYAQIGGKSPLLEITNAQAHSLEKELSFFGDFKVFVCMRYYHPMSAQVIKDIFSYQPKEIILLPLYPQLSSSTSSSSFDDFLEKFNLEQHLQKTKIKVKKVCCYFDDEDFILAHAKLIKQKINEAGIKDFDKLRFLFSAHGLPKKLIDQGDPYVFQIEETTKKTVEKLLELLNKDGYKLEEKDIDFKVCYQSKVGPLEWTTPSLDNEIRRVALDKKNPVIVPISFVSDHSETLVELDIDYKKTAKDLGIKKYYRVDSLNLNGHFIESLANLCKNAASKNSQCFSGMDAKRKCPGDRKMCGFN